MAQAKTRVDRNGRVVIPAEYRRALGMHEGDEVTVQLEDGAVRIITRMEAIRRAQEMVAKHNPERRSLVTELLEERRAEATRD
jgi:AbrB family looped-hinge helix DNA binding protein